MHLGANTNIKRDVSFVNPREGHHSSMMSASPGDSAHARMRQIGVVGGRHALAHAEQAYAQDTKGHSFGSKDSLSAKDSQMETQNADGELLTYGTKNVLGSRPLEQLDRNTNILNMNMKDVLQKTRYEEMLSNHFAKGPHV